MREPQPSPKEKPQEGVILFVVGGFKFAIAAGAVQEIRGLNGLQDIPVGSQATRTRKLRFTLDRDGITYFVVDASRHFLLPQSSPSRVLVLRGLAAAVLVDAADRMMDISVLHALPRAFTQEERAWYRGLTVVNGEVVPVVNAGAFLSQGEQEVLRAGLVQQRGAAAV